MEQLLYRISTAAELLDVSRATIYRLVKRGELVLVKFGTGTTRVTAESVAKLLAPQPSAQK